MSEAVKKRVRCAVYTRKSTDEGLDQEYNSINAQRDAGHAYIASQRAEGWIPVEHDYDDPANSGGTLDRPAMQRLLSDIQRDRIDVVVVYKIDRLTRSLGDFSKMIEVFDAHGVSFVSVTQQFNTTNSMGRLMLNILLSFAQFEREVTGERIRDKFSSSKKKGIWMGGIPPLGYDVQNRQLVINPTEAKTIHHIFKRFTELGSTTMLCKELQLDGYKTKAWTTQDGKTRKGRLIDRGVIYKVLSNQIYLGKIHHKGEWYEGRHEAIIDQSLWDQAHSIFKTNPHARGNKTRAKVHFLLKGIIFAPDGHALTTWCSAKKKNGKRYRYYISTKENKMYAGASGIPRLPAAEIESAVVSQIRGLLKTPPVVKQVVEKAKLKGVTLDEAQVTVGLTQIDKVWENLFPNEQGRIVRLLIEKIIVTANKIDMRLRDNGIERLAMEVTDSAIVEAKR